jgi:hypothetical protein
LHPDLTGGVYPANIVLAVIEDKELTWADGQLLSVYVVPFFAAENCFNGEAAYVADAVSFSGQCVEDDVVSLEELEMGIFIELG